MSINPLSKFGQLCAQLVPLLLVFWTSPNRFPPGLILQVG
jgi:hypothetical protein